MTFDFLGFASYECFLFLFLPMLSFLCRKISEVRRRELLAESEGDWESEVGEGEVTGPLKFALREGGFALKRKLGIFEIFLLLFVAIFSLYLSPLSIYISRIMWEYS